MARPAPEYRVWKAPGKLFAIEYSAVALTEMCRAAADGFERSPHGGVEIGGILLGVPNPNGVRLVTFQPVPCEYKTGPSYVLSENDRAAMAKAIESAQADAALKGFEPIGWYHSHTRNEVFLSKADLEVFNRFFPAPWHIAAVLRPSHQPTRIGFFFREPDGSMRAHSSYREITLAEAGEPVPNAARPIFGNLELHAEPIVTGPRPAEPAPVSQAREPRVSPERLAPVPSKPSRWYLISGLTMVIIAAGIWVYLWPRDPARYFTLSVADAAGQLQISWNREAVRGASHGVLEIDDAGVKSQIALDAAELAGARIFCQRRSNNVWVRMTVQRPRQAPLEESTRFIAPDGPAPQLNSESASSKPEVTAQPPTTPPVMPPEPAPAAKPPRAPASPAPRPVKESLPATVPAKPQSMPVQPLSVAQSAEPAQRPVPAVTSAPPPTPKVEVDRPASPATVASVPTTAPPAQTAPVGQIQPKAPATVKASGKIVWSGKAPGGTLVFEGGKVSAGSATGLLPGRPVQVTVYPAQSDARTAVIYTSDPEYFNQLVEAGDAQNGHKKLVYTWDPKRAGGVTIREAPSEQNGWRRMVLQVEKQVKSVVVEWSAIP